MQGGARVKQGVQESEKLNWALNGVQGVHGHFKANWTGLIQVNRTGSIMNINRGDAPEP